MANHIGGPSMKDLERALRERGLPVTVQRQIVFGAMASSEDHPTADEIFDRVKVHLPNISRTTVYRILDAFVQLRLINKVCHPGSAARFDAKPHRHHHLMCVRCERILDLDHEEGAHKITWPAGRAHGFDIRD